MFSKPTEPRSIAAQLVVLFTPAAAFLLFCGLGVLYWIVVRHAFEEDNAVLTDKMFALRAELKTPGGPDALSDELQTVRSGEHATYWIRLLDSSGRIIAETPAMNRLLRPESFPAPHGANATSAKPKNYRTNGKLFSLVATTEEAGGQLYTLQLAQDRSGDERFMREFGALLAAVLALGIPLSALLAITVARRGLRPLTEMTRSLQRVGPNRLSERVPPAEWPRELQPLAVAFDDMMDRLENSFTRLSQFSADLAHELRTPISIIRGEGEVALTRARSPEEYCEVIESSVAECERLSGIVDNLLFLARAEGADQQILRSRFDGRAAVEKIATFYEPVAEEQKVSLVLQGAGTIDADPALFGRAVSNLVENALHFTPAGGTLLISIAEHADESTVSVNDTGSGIEALHLPRLFDRFYRVDSSRSSRGTGLGLALVKSIMDLHGGSAQVESEVDRGTTVTLRFPTTAAVEG